MGSKPTKSQALAYIALLAKDNIVTRGEVIEAFDSIDTKEPAPKKKLGLAEIIYYIGGGIVFLGIAILIGQNWASLGFEARLLSTLGTVVIAFIAGLLLQKKPTTETLGTALYLIAALVLPVGLYVVTDQLGYLEIEATHSVISAVLLGAYLLSFAMLRKNIFLLFGIIAGTGLFFNFTSLVFDESMGNAWDFFAYRLLFVGVAYMTLGYLLAKTSYNKLTGALYGFGAFNVLLTGLILGGWKPDQNVVWEFIYPLLVFGVLYLSVYLKSKACLVWATIFLMLYILKITSEYFSENIGWPFALVLAGLAMIASGYLAVTIKQKYLPKK